MNRLGITVLNLFRDTLTQNGESEEETGWQRVRALFDVRWVWLFVLCLLLLSPPQDKIDSEKE